MSDEPSRDPSADADALLADLLSTTWEAYRNDDMTAGIASARTAVAAFPAQGEAWFWLACCLERNGELRAADRSFLRATKAATDPQPLPYRIGWTHFQRTVASAGDALPAPLRAALEAVTLVLADYAEPELLEGFNEPESLGLFAGQDIGDPVQSAQPLISPRIYLFRRAHEHQCSSREEFDDEVKQTLLHELGHYLGYDEDQLDALGRG